MAYPIVRRFPRTNASNLNSAAECTHAAGHGDENEEHVHQKAQITNNIDDRRIQAAGARDQECVVCMGSWKDTFLPSLEEGLSNDDYHIRVASLTLLGDLLGMLGGTTVGKTNTDTQDDIRQTKRAQA